MTDEQIMSMLSEIIDVVDYDIWKSMFLEGHAEEPELNAEDLARMVAIVRKYLDDVCN